MGKIGYSPPPDFPEGNEMATLKLLDLYSKIVPEVPFFRNYELDQIVRNSHREMKNYHTLLHMDAFNRMIVLGYVKSWNATKNEFIISNLGLTVKEKGGYFKYLDYLKIEKKRIDYREKAELKNIETSTKVNKWLLKTKWLPHVLSFLALVISCFAVYVAMTQEPVVIDHTQLHTKHEGYQNKESKIQATKKDETTIK